MSTTLLPPISAAGLRLLTIADVAALPDELPSGPVDYELDNGRLIVMPPPGNLHSATQSNIDTELKIQGERRGHGKGRVEIGVVLWRDPDRLVGPDAAFFANTSLPLRESSEGYLESIPDLAVEVRSPNDTIPELRRKVNDYLSVGVRAVWVLDPEKAIATEYRSGVQPRVLDEKSELTIEDVIPGFRVVVGDLFKQ